MQFSFDSCSYRESLAGVRESFIPHPMCHAKTRPILPFPLLLLPPSPSPSPPRGTSQRDALCLCFLQLTMRDVREQAPATYSAQTK